MSMSIKNAIAMYKFIYLFSFKFNILTLAFKKIAYGIISKFSYHKTPAKSK